jgi:putative heme-binding domain-containing protein
MPRIFAWIILSIAFVGLTLTGADAMQIGKKKADAKAAPAKPAKPAKATAAESIKVAKGFKVELLYTVPAETYGSWVNMCVDPKGRLIVSDQYGPMYRVTPPPLGGTDTPKIEPIPASIAGAQGLVWAFDALYTVVNSGGNKSGLYKVTSSKNNDTLDFVTLLKSFDGGGGEHGPHAVIKHPDGKRLTVVCGNQTRLVPFTTSKVPLHWGEDHLLPRMPDGRGFMKGVMGPGGAIYNVTPDGKDWELLSVGYRNQFDAAYNAAGDLFTYDADMEWDFNTPWYRPTRVCQVFPGSEYGWRNGAGKYPEYYADNWPPVVNVGPGSPTGVCFGGGAKFPKAYQDAFYICDWSYGKMYAVHMTPKGSTYAAQVEEFVAGTPLPLTDVVINPVDGAMYFTIGGRKTQSALYRVTATSEAFASPAAGLQNAINNSKGNVDVAFSRSQRMAAESWLTKNSEGDISTLLALLKSDDRPVRLAARAALEFQPVEKWNGAVMSATDANTVIHGLLALVRTTADCPSHKKPTSPKPDSSIGLSILAKLNSLDFKSLSDEQRLDAVRVYHVLFNRYGLPVADGRAATLAKFEALFPMGNRFLDGEISQILVALESPVAAAKLVKQLNVAATQEEQIDYARALRVLKTGWTPELRKEYFTWMQKADGYRGGNSFGGFLSQIRNDALVNVSPADRVVVEPLLTAKIKTSGPVTPARTRIVKQYKLEDLEPLLESGLKSGRDFERGRKMFAEANCASCHRYANEGGISGPDLTQAAGRFSAKDLLISMLDPNKEISDQYAAVEIETDDGRKIVGRIVNHNANGMVVNTNMLDPNANVGVKPSDVVSIKPSKNSLMPAGTIDVLEPDEVLDLMAYLLSRSDKANAMFKK